MKSSFVFWLVLILVIGLSLTIYLSVASTSKARVLRCFDLKIHSSGEHDREIEEKLNKKFPKGTSKNEVLAFLDRASFRNDRRNWSETIATDSDESLHCFFSGGGLFQVVFREYVVSFVFDKANSELKHITVAYGITGP